MLLFYHIQTSKTINSTNKYIAAKRIHPEMARAMEKLYYEYNPGDQILTPTNFTIDCIGWSC